MWTIEKQWVQIFERQEWVINQAKQQAFLLEQDLSSKLLLAGIPPSLAFNHQELISEVPFPRTRRAIPFSGTKFSGNHNPVVGRAHHQHGQLNVPLCPIGNEGLCASSGGSRREDLQLASVAGISNGFNEEDRREEDPSVASLRDREVCHDVAITPVRSEGLSNLRVCHDSEAGCATDGGIKDHEEDNPEDKRDAGVSDGCLDPAVSLARLQRSKSRQRALAIRNSTQKSRSRGKENVGDYGDVAIQCLISTPHSENVKELHGDDSLVEKAKIGEFQTEERGSHVYSGRVTRSRSSGRQERFLNVSSSPCIAGDSIVNSMEESDHVIHSPEKASSSRIADDSGREGELISRDYSSKGKQHVVETSGSSPEAEGNEGETGFEGLCSSPNGMLTSLHEGKESSYSSLIKQASGCPHDSLLEETRSALPTSIDIDGRSHRVKETVQANVFGFGDPSQFSNFSGSAVKVKSSPPANVDELYNNHPKMVEPKTVELQIKEEGSNMMSGRITRSRIFGNQENSLNACGLPDFYRTSSGTTVNIDSKEQSCLEGRRSTPASRKEIHGSLSEKRPLSFMHAEKNVEEGIITTAHGNYDSPQNINLLGNYGGSAKEMEVQGSLAKAVDELTESSRLSNVSERSSVEKADDIYTDAGSNTLLECGLTPQQRCSVIDDQAPLQVGSDCLVHSPVKEVTEVNAEKSKDLVSEERAVSSAPLSCPSKSRDGDYASVSSPGSHRFLDTETLEVDNPATSKNKLRSNPVLSTETAYISPERLQRSAIDDREEGGLEPTECQTAENFRVRITSYSRDGTSSKHKRRKIDDERVHDLSTSITLREDDFHAVKNDSDCGNLEREDYSPMDEPHVQGFTTSQEFAAEITVSGSHAEDHMVERSESLSQAQKKEGGTGLEGVDGSPNVPFTFSHGENESSVFSRLIMQFPEDPREFLLEETGRALPTNINNTGGSHSLIKDPLFLHHLDDIRLENAENAEERFGFEGTSNFSELSSSAPHVKSMDLTSADEAMSVLEKFVMTTDDDPHSIAEERSVFDDWNLPNKAVERASILEQLCLSACMQTPEAFSSASYQLQRVEHLQKSVRSGVSEHIDLQTTLHVIDNVEKIKDSNCCWTEEVGPAFNERSYSDCLPNFSGLSGWDIKKPCSSPVGKVWDRIASSSSSSGKRVSSVPALACINEEIENADEVADTFQGRIVSEVLDYSTSRPLLADITEIPNLHASVSKAVPYTDRLSLDSVTTEFSLTGTHKSVRKKPGIQNSTNRRYTNKENQGILRGSKDMKRATRSLQSRYNKPKVSEKPILRKKGPSLSELEPKPNNIVTNITSFIPLVQHKQAATALPVKRDIKVKSLEAAEAAKRLAERKDNERKMKKEAMKVERARMEQENLRKLELQKKMKEEERLKNEADMAAKKRQRVEEGKKEKQKKRMRVEAAWREQKEHEARVEKLKKELKCHANDGRVLKNKDLKCNTVRKKVEEEMEHETLRIISETDHRSSSVSENHARAGTAVQEDHCKGFTDFEQKEEVQETLDKGTPNEKLVVDISREQSYDISPYKESDDEDDEDDDSLPNNKFIPSWASKSCLALVASRQSVPEPEMIFHPKSFPSISEVVLPRKCQIQ